MRHSSLAGWKLENVARLSQGGRRPCLGGCRILPAPRCARRPSARAFPQLGPKLLFTFSEFPADQSRVAGLINAGCDWPAPFLYVNAAAERSAFVFFALTVERGLLGTPRSSSAGAANVRHTWLAVLFNAPRANLGLFCFSFLFTFRFPNTTFFRGQI